MCCLGNYVQLCLNRGKNSSCRLPALSTARRLFLTWNCCFCGNVRHLIDASREIFRKGRHNLSINRALSLVQDIFGAWSIRTKDPQIQVIRAEFNRKNSFQLCSSKQKLSISSMACLMAWEFRMRANLNLFPRNENHQYRML